MTKNLTTFKRSISLSIIAPLALVVVITTIIFYLIHITNKKEFDLIQAKQIRTSNQLYQSSLSEQLAIIASSTVFIDFINSGNITRNELMPKLLEQLATIHSKSLVGLSLVDTGRRTTFDYGKTADQALTLKLCYLANRLNNQYGNCQHLLRLYFSKPEVINELVTINHSIQSCPQCKPTDLFEADRFGSFQVLNKTPLLAYIKIEKEKDYIFYYYFIFIALLILFANTNLARIRKIINTTLANPIESLVKNIKNNTPRDNNPNALQEISYLIDQINEWEKKIKTTKEIEKHAALGKLTAQIAHDIRSPLAVMEMTIKASGEISSPLQISILNEAIQNVKDIANNLLETYRQPVELVDEEIQLAVMIESVVAQKRQEWRLEPCVVDFSCQGDAEAVRVFASGMAVRRMLSNLLNNAYEALVERREIKVGLELRQSHLLLTIADSGKGIALQEIAGVLKGKSSKHEGEGIGLPSATLLMASLGGKLDLTSTLHQGTCVTLLFPPQRFRCEASYA